MIKTVLSREGKKIWMVTKRIDGIKWYIGTYSFTRGSRGN